MQPVYQWILDRTSGRIGRIAAGGVIGMLWVVAGLSRAPDGVRKYAGTLVCLGALMGASAGALLTTRDQVQPRGKAAKVAAGFVVVIVAVVLTVILLQMIDGK